MGFNVNEGYYEKHVRQNGYKITDIQEKINAANNTEDGIKVLEQQYFKEIGVDIPVNARSKEPIEYVIEEQIDNNEIEF
ncbi:MAG: hypothetical protein HFJ57_00625 [Clostridia bacterium]|nr:hypothetical protein [Clostridia bacterium]